jgi:hypothetical protein
MKDKFNQIRWDYKSLREEGYSKAYAFRMLKADYSDEDIESFKKLGKLI